MSDVYHIPVLLNRAIDELITDPDGTYVDVTFGGGGHSKLILEKLSPVGKLFAFDQDPDAADNVIDDERFVLIPSDYRYIKNFLKLQRVEKLSGVLADLGVSSHQFDAMDRGFSIRGEGKLDMRMNPKTKISAYELLQEIEYQDLINILRKYGEVKPAPRIAQSILKKRDAGELKTTVQLVDAVKGVIPQKKSNQVLAQVFQAIRIQVNDELTSVEEMLKGGADLLTPKSRFVVISYHSLEDRLVKNFFKRGKFEGDVEKDFFGNPIKPLQEVFNKPIVPDEKEIGLNPRARSAKMRVAEKEVEK